MTMSDDDAQAGVEIEVGVMGDVEGGLWIKLTLSSQQSAETFALAYTRDEAARLVELIDGAVRAIDARNN